MRTLNATILAGLLFGAPACSSLTPEADPAGAATSADTTPASEPAAAAASHTTTSPVAAPHLVAAERSLDTLAKLANARNYQALGFQSESEARSVSLGMPLPMTMVGLNPLKAYRRGDDPLPLFIEQKSVLYPAMVAGDVRSSIVVSQGANGAWEDSSFGNARLARMAHAGRLRAAATTGHDAAEFSLVQIPTLNLTLLRHDVGGTPMLTPLTDLPEAGLQAGRPEPAVQVFEKLQPLAAQNDGTAPN
jgi:hypothetical protein